MKLTLRITCAMTLTGLAGCIPLGTSAERMTYPDSWPRLAAESTCQAMDGRYHMKGENAQFSSNSVNGPTLFALFRRAVNPQRTQAWITFDTGTSTITVEAHGGADGYEHFSKPVTCIDGSITYTDKGTGHGDGTKLHWDDTITLSKAENGALIAHARGKGRVYEAFFRQDSEHDVLYKFEPVTAK